MMSRMGASELLRRAGEGLGDSLQPETRRRLVRHGVSTVRESAAGRQGLAARLPLMLTAGSALAVVAIVLVVPSMLTTTLTTPPQPLSTPDAILAAVTPVRDLSVVADGERVVLNWSDGGATRKVFRATSHHELANIKALPAKTVSGETWTDEEPATAPIVYYVIE